MGGFIICVGRMRSQEKGHSYHEQCVLLYYLIQQHIFFHNLPSGSSISKLGLTSKTLLVSSTTHPICLAIIRLIDK